jgi:hypothetical protein
MSERNIVGQLVQLSINVQIGAVGSRISVE